jgi:hypothetical protein
MNSFPRAAGALLLTSLAVFALPATAHAAAPANDSYGGATPVTIGFSEELDTSAATTDPDDTQLAEPCWEALEGFTDASVWYSFTSPVDVNVAVDVSASDYPAVVLVGTGPAGNMQTVRCRFGVALFAATAGVTYHVLVVDPQFDGGGNGGLTRISFAEGPALPTVELTLDRVGHVDRQAGTASIGGTYRCTDAGSVQFVGEGTQRIGRFNVRGFFRSDQVGTCDGTVHLWRASLRSEVSKFSGGPVQVAAYVVAIGDYDNVDAGVEQTVRLNSR